MVVAGVGNTDVIVFENLPTSVALVIGYLTMVESIAGRYGHFWNDVRHVPVKTLTLEILLQLESLIQRSPFTLGVFHPPGVVHPGGVVEIVFEVFAHPRVRYTHEVLLPRHLPPDVLGVGEGPEDVAHPGAGEGHHGATAHPRPEGQLQVLPAPDSLQEMF